MLKVAILDKSCFARMHHPARSLLNALAEAAVGWQSEYGRDSAFYARIEGFVRQVLTDFDDDVSVFAEVLKALREFLDEEKHKAEYEAEQTTRLLKRRERLALAASAPGGLRRGSVADRPQARRVLQEPCRTTRSQEVTQ